MFIRLINKTADTDREFIKKKLSQKVDLLHRFFRHNWTRLYQTCRLVHLVLKEFMSLDVMSSGVREQWEKDEYPICL